MNDPKRSPFPVRDFFGQLQRIHKINGNGAVLQWLSLEDNLVFFIGVLAVASEMEMTPEWQGVRMKMWSQASHDQKRAAADLANIAASRYEKP